jgi:hypothetical protein
MRHSPDDLDVTGTEIDLQGRLYNMLEETFKTSDSECDIPIRFLMSDEGKQNNPVRDDIILLFKRKSLDNCKKLAKHLQKVTTARSGFGLLFVIVGENQDKKIMLISRFPADRGIMAETSGKNALKVEFLERIFMKNEKSYKSALYSGQSYDGDFWDGFATDKQVNSGVRDLSNYWINDFLRSDFKTTSKQGTKRLANALKTAIREAPNLNIKNELVSCTVLASNLNNQRVSIDSFASKYSLSEEAKKLVTQQLKNPRLLNDHFVFDLEEFRHHAAFKTVELSNGSILTAESNKFNDCFEQLLIDEVKQIHRFSTEGTIKDEKIRSRV